MTETITDVDDKSGSAGSRARDPDPGFLRAPNPLSFVVPNPWTRGLQTAVLGWLLAVGVIGELNLATNGNRGRPLTFWLAAILTELVPLIVGVAVTWSRVWSFYLMLVFLLMGALVIPRAVSVALGNPPSWRASAGAVMAISEVPIGLLLLRRAWTSSQSNANQST